MMYKIGIQKPPVTSFLPFSVRINCSGDFKFFANSFEKMYHFYVNSYLVIDWVVHDVKSSFTNGIDVNFIFGFKAVSFGVS